MNDRNVRAMAKWPNVPAVYGWLRLDQRGQWWLRDERLDRPQWLSFLGEHYAADVLGNWYFQNGPQQVFVELDYAPLVLRSDTRHGLVDHTGRPFVGIAAVSMDEHGAVMIAGERGAGLMDGADLDWFADRIRTGDEDLETALSRALERDSGEPTSLYFHLGDACWPVTRVDAQAVPTHHGFVRKPSR